MKAASVSISEFLTNKQFFVPPYQRPYQWDADNAEQLVQDVYDSYQDNNEEEYFIGSAICIERRGERLEIVDGQQRLITLTFILLQLANFVEIEGYQHQLRAKVIQENYGVEPPERNFCIRVRDAENDFYQEYIVAPDNTRVCNDNEQVFANNYLRIGEYIQQKITDGMNQQQLRAFATYFTDKVRVVFVTVDDQTSAFRLFNVLNKRGLPLSDADLIKNAILHTVHDPENPQHMQRAEKAWSKLENRIEAKDLTRFFVRHQVSEKEDRNRAKEKAFDYYRATLTDREEAFNVLNTLLKSAGHYEEMLNEESSIQPKKTLLFLKSLSKHDEWLPAFIAFRNSGRFDDAQFIQFAQLFEKVYMHSFFKGEGSSKREAACYHAIEAINNDCEFDALMSLLTKELSDNDGFELSLDKEKFYDASRPLVINFVKAVLLRVEIEGADDSVLRRYPDWKKITVEHILPRSMVDPYWQNQFPNPEDRAEWLDKLGNLTLLARSKNSAARNYDFQRKKREYERSNEISPFAMTQELCRPELEDWNMAVLQNRHEEMKQKILNLWLVDKSLL